MKDEYHGQNSVMLPLPDAQLDITLCLSRGFLRDTFSESFSITADEGGFIQEARGAKYSLHFDAREILGLPSDCKLDLSKLTDDQEEVLTSVVLRQLSRLRRLGLQAEIGYTTKTHSGFVAISGDGLKGLTMAKVIETITATD